MAKKAERPANQNFHIFFLYGKTFPAQRQVFRQLQTHLGCSWHWRQSLPQTQQWQVVNKEMLLVLFSFLTKRNPIFQLKSPLFKLFCGEHFIPQNLPHKRKHTLGDTKLFHITLEGTMLLPLSPEKFIYAFTLYCPYLSPSQTSLSFSICKILILFSKSKKFHSSTSQSLRGHRKMGSQ